MIDEKYSNNDCEYSVGRNYDNADYGIAGKNEQKYGA